MGTGDEDNLVAPCKILGETFAGPPWLQVYHVACSTCLLFKCLEDPQVSAGLRCLFEQAEKREGILALCSSAIGKCPISQLGAQLSVSIKAAEHSSVIPTQ